MLGLITAVLFVVSVGSVTEAHAQTVAQTTTNTKPLTILQKLQASLTNFRSNINTKLPGKTPTATTTQNAPNALQSAFAKIQANFANGQIISLQKSITNTQTNIAKLQASIAANTAAIAKAQSSGNLATILKLQKTQTDLKNQIAKQTDDLTKAQTKLTTTLAKVQTVTSNISGKGGSSPTSSGSGGGGSSSGSSGSGRK